MIIVFYELAFELAIGVDAQGSRYQSSSICTPGSMGRHPVTIGTSTSSPQLWPRDAPTKALRYKH